ncbi:MAG: hypothetical protein KF891_25555 [Rhizobacter sp.]|nr:hypothetical protein [Rhizobacter sp.]
MHTEPPCEDWLALVADEGAARALQTTLQGAVPEVRHLGAGTRLVHCSTWCAPQAIVLHLGSGSHGPADIPLETPAGWDVHWLLVGRPEDPPIAALASRLADSGAHHWLPDGDAVAPADWMLALAFARAAHRRDQARRQRIAGLQDQLAEQRVVASAERVRFGPSDCLASSASIRARAAALVPPYCSAYRVNMARLCGSWAMSSAITSPRS